MIAGPVAAVVSAKSDVPVLEPLMRRKGGLLVGADRHKGILSQTRGKSLSEILSVNIYLIY